MLSMRFGFVSKRTSSWFGAPSSPPSTPAMGYLMPTIQVDMPAGESARFTTREPGQPRHCPAPPLSVR